MPNGCHVRPEQTFNLIWGYADRWAELATGTAVGAGNANALTVAVPPGYVYVLQAFSVDHNAGVVKPLTVFAATGVVSVPLFSDASAASGTYYVWSGDIVLKAGDQVWALLLAPGAGKVVNLLVWGYKMIVQQ